jgi:hypothetical protein
MKFDTKECDVFEDGEHLFEFNHKRIKFLSKDIFKNYQKQLDKLAKRYKKCNDSSRFERAEDMASLYYEWNSNTDGSTIYIVQSKDDPNTFTSVYVETGDEL